MSCTHVMLTVGYMHSCVHGWPMYAMIHMFTAICMELHYAWKPPSLIQQAIVHTCIDGPYVYAYGTIYAYWAEHMCTNPEANPYQSMFVALYQMSVVLTGSTMDFPVYIDTSNKTATKIW